MKMSLNIFLSLGSNLGNREISLDEAIKLIRLQVGKVVKQSSLYETVSWGNDSKNLYLNKIIEVETNLAPFDLLEKLLAVEKKLGRIRNRDVKYQDRTIDIDILFYEDVILHSDDLQIPHPRIEERRFVLEPLNELAPDFIHPLLKKPINQLLIECEDKLMVRKL
jgi:2-amino-4-hydroxy-6-hydroxymethyldihydropteridine diphosphokinase